ncbi:hypothetical protein MMC07_006306 [Pseudocyphellaria aurata]|nr:hypothetical protein [Pseudocyphellaria aurata]
MPSPIDETHPSPIDETHPSPIDETRPSPIDETRSSPIVHINGFPGTGKFTIARLIVDKLSAFNAKLVPNRLLIHPADVILPRSSEDYQPLRQALRAAVFETLIKSRDTFDSLYIFTDFQSNDELGRSVVAEYASMAKLRNCAFIPIIISCTKEENLRRLESAERARRNKLTDTSVLSSMRSDCEVHRSEDEPYQMVLNTTNFQPEDAADTISSHIMGVCVGESPVKRSWTNLYS